MKVTKEWLKEKRACVGGYEWYMKQTLTDGVGLVVALIADTTEEEHLNWANWLLVRIMKRKQCLAYAIFAAEQVIKIYEKKYPKDNRHREAIEAAKKVLKNDTKENRTGAYAAAYAADAATYVGYAAANAAYAAANAAYAAAASAKGEMLLKIVNYGLRLLGEEI